MNQTALKAIPVIFPPENEQHRIVKKIEQLFSELDQGIKSLKTARDKLKIYSQSLLKQAFEGKLTEKWRLENADKLETAEELLKRIKAERELRYQQQIDDWKQKVKAWEDKGKDGKKPAKPRKIKELSPLNEEELRELPYGWLWEKLGWMTCAEGIMPVLRMGNIQNTKFDWTDLVYTSNTQEIEKYSLNKGDVLFNRTNSPELVGKTAIYKGEIPALFAGYLIRINHIDTIINSQYLNLFLNSYIAKQHGNKVKTDGVNQSNINGEKLSNYPFPYCSLSEQEIIVQKLEEKLSTVDQLEQTIEENLKKSESLRQSILKKAFSGQLVPQNPNDEPASVLLERIKAEKAEMLKQAKLKGEDKISNVVKILRFLLSSK